MRGKSFSYDGCELFPADTDTAENEDQLMKLAADVLIDILENMKGENT